MPTSKMKSRTSRAESKTKKKRGSAKTGKRTDSSKKTGLGKKTGSGKKAEAEERKSESGMPSEWDRLKARVAAAKAKKEAEEKRRAILIAKVKAEEAKEAEKKRLLEEKRARERLKDSKGVRHALMTELPEFCELFYAEGKTPLILDPEKKFSTFLSYQSNVRLSMKKYIVEVFVKKSLSPEEAREEMRQKFVSALKLGFPLWIDLSNTSPNFAKNFSAPDTFPHRKVLTPGVLDEKKQFMKLTRPDDLKHGELVLRRDPKTGEDITFRAIVTTEFALDEYEEFLQNSLPLNLLGPIEIIEMRE